MDDPVLYFRKRAVNSGFIIVLIRSYFRGGSEGLTPLNPLGTLTEPSLNPHWTLTEPSLNPLWTPYKDRQDEEEEIVRNWSKKGSNILNSQGYYRKRPKVFHPKQGFLLPWTDPAKTSLLEIWCWSPTIPNPGRLLVYLISQNMESDCTCKANNVSFWTNPFRSNSPD